MSILKNRSEVFPGAAGEQKSPVDATIKVTVSEDGLSASLWIDPPEHGGATPNFASMLAAISIAGVIEGIDRPTLDALDQEPVYHRSIRIAQGVAPVQGVNGQVQIHFNAGQRNLKPKENEDGTVDYRNLDLVENVVAGQLLCTITAPTEGSPGRSVRGAILPQKKGRPAPSCVGKNTELGPDSQSLYAKVDGQVDLIGQRVTVNETYHVKGDVDMATGNLRTVGNLVIRGSVKPGFSIETGGSLDVYGTVESANLKAGGNIRLRSGIMGSELHCDGSLVSRFIENCKVHVKGDVDAEYIMHSNVSCGANLTTTGKRARILGGQCVASGNIQSGTIGSASYVKTKVEISSREAILGRHQELLAQREGLEKLMESLKPLLTLFAQLHRANKMTPEKQESFADILQKQKTAVTALEEVNARLEEITESIQNHGGGKIICPGTIFPGSEIVIGTAKYEAEQPMKNTSFAFADGGIYCGPAR